MKKKLLQLMAICPGRVDIEINKHILFGETAKDVINRTPKDYMDAPIATMKRRNSIIRLEALPITKDMYPVIVYHYDLQKAIEKCLNIIELWEKEN